MSLGGEFALQLKIILDNAVMYNHNAAGAVAVRVRVFFGWPAVRGPARVADAERAVERMLAQDLFQIPELARRTPELERLVAGAAHSDSGRVVAPVFEAP